jgi:hypothetical protein
MKSFRQKDGSDDPPGPGHNRERDFHGEQRTNTTHVWTTDPDARLFRKGPTKEARPVFYGACADGEPQRAGGRRGGDPRFGPRRAVSRLTDGKITVNFWLCP